MTLSKKSLCTVAMAFAVATAACSDKNATPTTGSTTTEPVAQATLLEASTSLQQEETSIPSTETSSTPANTTKDTFIASTPSKITSITAYEEASESSPTIVEIENPKVFASGEKIETVFQVIDKDSVDGWIQVKLPIRPNGSTGWIQSKNVSLQSTGYRIEINRANHLLTLYEYDKEVISTPVAIGVEGSTATPEGEFYITELLKNPDPQNAYGPFAFGLSGFSEDLESFAGGEAIIGIHGTNEPEKIGTDVSSGCVRVPNKIIEEMKDILPLGTPVKIV